MEHILDSFLFKNETHFCNVPWGENSQQGDDTQTHKFVICHWATVVIVCIIAALQVFDRGRSGEVPWQARTSVMRKKTNTNTRLTWPMANLLNFWGFHI